MPRQLLRVSLRVFALALALVVAMPAISTPPAAGYPVSHLRINGHGWGHGRGMGQYGALGYALDHGWTWERILDHYYGGTSMTTLSGSPEVTVQLMRVNGQDTIVGQEKGQLTIDGQPGVFGAARAVRVGSNRFRLDTASSCGGPWTPIGTVDGPVVFRSGLPASDDHRDMLQQCDASGIHWYRGNIQAHDYEGTAITVNALDIESYLRGSVPRESPASWGDLGGGAGMHQLRAQSVAARSYAWRQDRAGPAKTCDTTACQVYLGRAHQPSGGAFTTLEDARTDRAIVDTTGSIRVHNSTGAVASTEYSSSTGGWTAGGSFPAVEDLGDSISNPQNPNHNWTTDLPVSTVEAAYGLGSLQGVEIRSRNGLGDMGGRVLSMRLGFSGGTVSLTGDEFRQKFGLKSNWFTITDAVGLASFPYHVAGTDGGVFAFGGAPYRGSLPEVGVQATVRGMAEGPDGYWLLGQDGGVFSFGVPFHGSMGGQRLNQPVVGMAATVPGQGYWLVASDGGIFSFGDASFYGSTGAIRLNQPVVGMAATPTGSGYWMVASDGGIFSFGDAIFHGSTGAIRLNQPVVAMAPHPSGDGYWLLAADGGLFAFGAPAAFHGSLPGAGVRERAVGMVVSPSGNGYLILTAEGHVFGFGDASSGGGPVNYGSKVPSAAIGAVRTS